MWILASRGAPGSFPAAQPGRAARKSSPCVGLRHLEEIPSWLQHPAAPSRPCKERGPAWELVTPDPRYPTPVSPSPDPTRVPQEELGSGFTSPACWILISHHAFAKSSAAWQQREVSQPSPSLGSSPVGWLSPRGPAGSLGLSTRKALCAQSAPSCTTPSSLPSRYLCARFSS